MNIEDCFELGIIARTYSFKGEVILHIDSDYPEDYYDLDMFYLLINNKLVPFFIDAITQTNKVNQIRVKLEDVNSEEQAERIVKKKVMLPLEELPELDDDQFYYHEIIGYQLIDEKKGVVGEILDVVENPGNTLLEVKMNMGNQLGLFPMNDNTFVKIDKNKKEITLSIPEGLIDLYS